MFGGMDELQTGLTGQLYRLVRRHNQEVLTLAGVLFPLVALGWFLYFWIVQWLTLLALTIFHGPDTALPENWFWMAGGIAVAMFILAILTHRLERRWYGMPGEGPWPARRFLLEFLLLIPRLSLLMLGTLRAYIRVVPDKLRLWQELLVQFRERTDVPLTSIDLPRDARGRAWLWEAAMLQLCELRHDPENGQWLIHATPAGKKLALGKRVRLPESGRRPTRRQKRHWSRDSGLGD